MSKILFIGPQNVISNDDGGKQGILGSLESFTEYTEVYYSFPVLDIQLVDYQAYFKKNINVLPFELNTEDKLVTYIKSLFTHIPFKFYKYYSKGYAKQLVEFINSNNIKVIILHHSHMGVYNKYIKSKTTAKIYLREHNIEYELVKMFCKNTKNIIYKILSFYEYIKTKHYETLLWKNVEESFFVSDNDYKIAKKINKNVFCIYNGIKFNEFQITINYGTYFLFSGSLKTIQNLLSLKWFLKKVWFNLPKSIYSKYPLFITGTMKNDVLDLLKIKESQCEKYNIHLKGYVDNYLKILDKSFALVSPSLIGSGIRVKVIEAMSRKKIIFCTHLDVEMMEKLQDLHNIVEFNNASDFQNKLSLLENRITYRDIVNNGYTYVHEELTWDIHAKKILQRIGM
jgi:glycosyltransferase involved in cell wall biosynthesis